MTTVTNSAGKPMVKVVRVFCGGCPREFKTVPSVVEVAMPPCPNCGSRMQLGEAEDVSVLRKQ